MHTARFNGEGLQKVGNAELITRHRIKCYRFYVGKS